MKVCWVVPEFIIREFDVKQDFFNHKRNHFFKERSRALECWATSNIHQLENGRERIFGYPTMYKKVYKCGRT